MEQQIREVMLQLFIVILQIGAPLAGLRLAVAGLKALAGDQEAVPTALRQVGIGLFIIFTSQTIVYFIEQFSRAVAVVRQGW